MRPWSVTNWRSRLVFLKSSASTVKSILGFGRGVRTSRAPGRPPEPRLSDFSGRVLRGMLLDFAMEGVTAQRAVIFHQLQLFGLELLVSRGRVARRRQALFAGLRALDGDNFSRHIAIPSLSA